MFTGLDAAALADARVILGIVMVLIVFGGLVPRWVHKLIVNEKDRELAVLRSLVKEQSEQIGLLVRGGDTTVHVLDELRRVAAERREAT